MPLKDDIKKELRSLHLANIHGKDERYKSDSIVTILLSEEYQAQRLGKQNKIILGINIFGWNPEFDDIIVKDDFDTIFIEVKYLRNNKEGYRYTEALSQSMNLKNYIRSNNINGHVLILLLCSIDKTSLNSAELLLAQQCSMSRHDIIIVR